MNGVGRGTAHPRFCYRSGELRASREAQTNSPRQRRLPNGQPIPAQHTCDGRPVSAAQAGVSSAPARRASRSSSTTLTRRAGHSVTGAPAIFPPARVRSPPASAPASQAVNDFGKPGYGGPCPPKGHGAHHYHFKLLRTRRGHTRLSAGAKVEDVEKAAQEGSRGEPSWSDGGNSCSAVAVVESIRLFTPPRQREV